MVLDSGLVVARSESVVPGEAGRGRARAPPGARPGGGGRRAQVEVGEAGQQLRASVRRQLGRDFGLGFSC